MSLTEPQTMTEAALEARRRNARQSTGPRSASGKARSRLNALRHGGYASPAAWTDDSLRALGEDPADFHELVVRFKCSAGPAAGPLWEYAAEDMARQVWRRLRLDRAWESLAVQAAERGEPLELVFLTEKGKELMAQSAAAEHAVDRKMRVLLRLREAEARRQRDENKRFERQSHSLLGAPAVPVATRPASTAAVSPEPAEAAKLFNSGKRSGDVVESTRAESNGPRARSILEAPLCPPFVTGKSERSVSDDEIREPGGYHPGMEPIGEGHYLPRKHPKSHGLWRNRPAIGGIQGAEVSRRMA